MNTSMGDFKLATAEWAHSVLRYLREAGELVSRESLRNRRRARRRDLRLPVTFYLLNGDGDEAQARVAYTRDLSTEGLSLLLPASLEEGVTLELELDLRRAPMRAVATVVRCDVVDVADAKAGYLVAATFTRMGEEDRRRLHRHLRRTRSF